MRLRDNVKAAESSSIKMAVFSKESGARTNAMDVDTRYSLMAILTKAIMNVAKLTGKAYTHGRMERYTMENGNMV